MRTPRIAVLLDETTSTGGTKYEAHKGYFRGLTDAGAAAYGVPYAPAMIEGALATFDGLMSVGGRFAYPDDWYVGGAAAKTPPSERFEMERGLMGAFLAAGKPVLGICAGMQMLACLHGSRMTPDIAAWKPSALPHDEKGRLHALSVASGSRLGEILGVDALTVNTFHREAVIELGQGVRASAVAEDGVIEAVEIDGAAFALGVQWHPELRLAEDRLGARLFEGFVAACGRQGGPASAAR